MAARPMPPQELLLPVKPGFIVFTLIAALLANLLPWSGWALWIVPDFVALMVLYWCIEEPRKIGFLTAWFLGLLMDVADGSLFGQHALAYTLLAYAGLRAIPDAYFQAARIDGATAWAIFRYIQLPKMRGVLVIAVLLRFMDSFLIYAEPFVLTGGGPGNSTTFLSIYLVKLAVGQFDLGPAAAFSIIYFLIVLLFSFVFYQALQRIGTGDKR